MSITWDHGGEFSLSRLSLQDMSRLIKPALQSFEIMGHDVYCSGNQCGRSHWGPCSLEKTFIALSASLRQCFHGASRWSISDTTAGLLKVHKRHVAEGAKDTISGIEVKNRVEIEEMLEWLRWSTAAYEKDKLALAKIVKIQEQDVVKMVTKSAVKKPAFFIAVHHARHCVVMSIRGTYATSDLLTDLNPHNEPFERGAAHSGMLGAAKWLLENEGHTLQTLLANNQGYKLVFTGHSLGGAIAALLTMLVRASRVGWFLPTTSLGIRSSKIFCWGFGCPPCVDRTLADSSNFICNVVLQDDVVPRVSAAAIEVLRNEIQETGWCHVVKDGKAKKAADAIEYVGVSDALKRGSKVGASVFQKFQHAHITNESGSSSHPTRKQLMDSSDNSKYDDEETDTGMAAQAIVALAAGSSANLQELEKRRLFVPGVLYHITRHKIKKEDRVKPIVPVRPFQEGEDAPRNSKYKHVIIRGIDPTWRFGRIIVSGTLFSDHGCYNYRDGMLDAIESCQKVAPTHLNHQRYVLMEM